MRRREPMRTGEFWPRLLTRTGNRLNKRKISSDIKKSRSKEDRACLITRDQEALSNPG